MPLPTPTEILRPEPEELAPLLLDHLQQTAHTYPHHLALGYAVSDLDRHPLGPNHRDAPAAARCIAEA